MNNLFQWLNSSSEVLRTHTASSGGLFSNTNPTTNWSNYFSFGKPMVEPPTSEPEPFVIQTTNTIPSNDDSSETVLKPCPTTIKHIVISGGGEYGFSFYSALRYSNIAGFWKIENIESIYGTSIGTFIAVIILLLPFFNWEILDDFIIKRPWHNLFDFNIKNILPAIKQNGIFSIKVVEDLVSPLFRAIDIPLDINMRDFYTFTRIELHLITVNITDFELVDISYKTHPEWKVIDAMYCSMCLPILFIPHKINDTIYIDGGLLLNYPVNICIGNGAHKDEILGLSKVFPEGNQRVVVNTLIDYIFYIIGSLLSKVSIKPVPVKNQIEFITHDPFVNIYSVYKCTSQKEYRTTLLQNGSDVWNEFYHKTYDTQFTEERLVEKCKESDENAPEVDSPSSVASPTNSDELPFPELFSG